MQPFVYPRNDLSYAGNFLNMMFSTPCEPYEVDQDSGILYGPYLICTHDHEQNASTSTVHVPLALRGRTVCLYRMMLTSLWGPAHGVVLTTALKMLEEISSVKHIPEFVRSYEDKANFATPDGLPAFHLSFKNYDPRATVMRETCHEVLKKNWCQR